MRAVIEFSTVPAKKVMKNMSAESKKNVSAEEKIWYTLEKKMGKQ